MRGPVGVSVSRPTIHLSQGTVVVGAIFGAWILWLAVNNKLIVYWQILTGQGGAQVSQAPNTVVNNPISTTGQPTTGTGSGTVTTLNPLAPSSVAGAGTQIPGFMGF